MCSCQKIMKKMKKGMMRWKRSQISIILMYEVLGSDWATLAYKVYRTEMRGKDKTLINEHFTQHGGEGYRNAGLEMFLLEVNCTLCNKKNAQGREKNSCKVVEIVSLECQFCFYSSIIFSYIPFEDRELEKVCFTRKVC